MSHGTAAARPPRLSEDVERCTDCAHPTHAAGPCEVERLTPADGPQPCGCPSNCYPGAQRGVMDSLAEIQKQQASTRASVGELWDSWLEGRIEAKEESRKNRAVLKALTDAVALLAAKMDVAVMAFPIEEPEPRSNGNGHTKRGPAPPVPDEPDDTID